MDLTVNADDTVDGAMIIALDREVAEMSGDADSMVEEMLGGEEGIPEGATAERYEDDDYVGAQYTFEGESLDEFALDEGETDTLSIVHEGDEFVASGVLDFGAGAGDMGELGELPEELGGDMFATMEVRIAITFPGRIVETNGEVDGTTVTWEPEGGERLDIEARAKDSGGAGLPVWAWIVIGVVVVAAIAGLLYVLSRSRKAAAEGPPDAGAGAGAPPAYPPPPPPGGTAPPGPASPPSGPAEPASPPPVDGAGEPPR